MADITWIKIRTNMFDDEKIRLIERMPEGDGILITWVKLLAYAGKVNCNGYIMINENIPMNVEQVAIIFNRPFEKVKYAISVLQSFGMLDVTENEIIAISNWEKHQNVEGMDKIRTQNRERKRLERERKKTLLLENDKDQKCHVTVTGRHATDIEKEIDKEKEYNTMSPSKLDDVDEVLAHYKKLSNIPQFKTMPQKRKSSVNARLKELSGGKDEMIYILNQINDCQFFVDSKSKSWFTFDWIFNPNNFAKIIEGKYFKTDNVNDKKDEIVFEGVF